MLLKTLNAKTPSMPVSRDAANSNRIDRVTSEQGIQDLSTNERDKVLDEEEYRAVLRTWAEAGQDHETARELLLQTVAIETNSLDGARSQTQTRAQQGQQPLSYDIRSTAQDNQNLLDAAQLASDLNAREDPDHNHETQRKTCLSNRQSSRARETAEDG